MRLALETRVDPERDTQRKIKTNNNHREIDPREETSMVRMCSLGLALKILEILPGLKREPILNLFYGRAGIEKIQLK